MGHLHTAREHTQRYRLVMVAGLTKFDIIPLSASDLDRFAWEKERSRLRCSRQKGGDGAHLPPSPHQQHTHPPPSWCAQIECACMMRVCEEEQKGGVRRGSAQRAVSQPNINIEASKLIQQLMLIYYIPSVCSNGPSEWALAVRARPSRMRILDAGGEARVLRRQHSQRVSA